MTDNASKKLTSKAAPLATTVKATGTGFLRINKGAPSVPAQALSQLKQKIANAAHAPLSSPGIDPVLPEDDLAAFFKNRAVMAGSSGGTERFIKFLLIVSAVLGSFTWAYNYKPKFRHAANTQARNWLGISLNDYIPEFGPRKKKKLGQGAAGDPRGSASRGQKPTVVKQILNIDPVAILIRNGQWREVDAKLNGRCATWDASSDCALKGFFYATKGFAKLARPMINVPEAKVALLKPADKALWYMTTALLAGDSDKTHARFKASLAATTTSSYDLRRFIFDELIYSSFASRKPLEVSFYVQEASKDPSAPFWSAAMIKWKILETSARGIAPSAGLLEDFFKNERGSLRFDPRGVEALAPVFIRGGRAERFVELTTEAVTESTQMKLDPEFQKRVLAGHLRTLWALGRRGEASATVMRYAAYSKKDVLSRHYQAAALLQNGSPDQASRSLVFLGPLGSNSPWETLYLQGFALIRAGQPQKAAPIIALIGKASVGSNQKRWAEVLRAEFLISQRRFPDALKIVEPMVKGPVFPVLAAEILRRTYDGLGRDQESAALRLKIDDAKAKKSYWSSPEMLGSPLGPLALLR